MPTASYFRSRARERLQNSPFSAVWLMMLAVALIVTAITAFASNFGLTFLVAGFLGVGSAAISLRLSRDTTAEVNIGELFLSFKGDRFVNDLVLGLLYNLFITLWTLLFFVPGLIKSYSYSMAYYIHLDNPHLSANECITASRRMMDGHKWRLFCLDCSFIGWVLLGILTLGVVALWVAPYQQMAHVYFYNDLLAREQGNMTNPFDTVVTDEGTQGTL